MKKTKEAVDGSVYEEYKEEALKEDAKALETQEESKDSSVYELTEEDMERLIKAYNEQNAGVSYIEPGKPTPEEIKVVSDEYTSKVEAFNAKTFTIADSAKALRVAKFLKKWNENDVQWNENGWRGTIMFDSWIKSFIDECQKEETALVLDWGTLTYLYMFMQNVNGVGLKSAIKFSETAEEYGKILEVITDEFNKHNEEGKEIQKLQERWRAYEGGYKLHYVDAQDPTK